MSSQESVDPVPWGSQVALPLAQFLDVQPLADLAEEVTRLPSLIRLDEIRLD